MRNNPYRNFDENAETGDISSAQTPEPIDGDRGEPITKAPKRKKPGTIIAVIAVLIFSVLALVFGGLFFYRMVVANSEDASKKVAEDPALTVKQSTGPDLGAYQQQVAQKLEEQKRMEAIKAAESAAAPPIQPNNNSAAPSGQQSVQPSLGRQGVAQTDNGKRVLTPQEEAAQRRLKPGLLWESDSGSGRSQSTSGGRQNGYGHNSLDDRAAGAGEPQISATGDFGGLQNSSGQSSIGGMLKTESYPNGYAYIRPDLKFLLINGTTIPCTLLPHIVTNYPGQTSCLINRDVYSADGSVVLISRGSKATGDRKVSINKGVAEVFVSWGWIDTPDGVRVRIDSMAADQLGAAGLDAWIDNHFAERFGGAILLSFLDDAFSALAYQTRGNQNGINFDNSTSNGQDMANTALENTINIPPTGHVQQATETTIIVARDIDFRSVYGVQQ